MASLIYTSSIDDVANGNIDFGADTFYALLVTNAYTPDKDTHTKRSDVTDEVAAGLGYATGGAATAASVTKDIANDRVDVTFAVTSWAAASFTARAAVIYKRRGGLAAADELVAYSDFLADKTGLGGSFEVTFSTPYRFQN